MTITAAEPEADTIPAETRTADTTTAETMAQAEDQLLQVYLQEIRQFPPLTPGEEQRLLRARHEGGEVAEEAERALLQGYLQLVVSIAETYVDSGLRLLDLIQEGNVGLLRAIRQYDPADGGAFAGFAGPRIAEAITQGIADW